MKRWLRGAGVAAMVGAPSSALAAGLGPAGGSGAVYVSYTFGTDSPAFGWGVEGRFWVLLQDVQCGDDSTFVGGTARFGLQGLSEPRFLIGTQAGASFGEVVSLSAELGLGYRFGAHAGLETFIGPEVSAKWGTARVSVDPLRVELAVAAGARFPAMSDGVPCYIVGRPHRAEEGFAPLPAFAAAARDPEAGARTWCDRARTELASVPAFTGLAAQLAASGAPDELIARARRAADDEVRHAAISAHLAARAHGAPVVIAPAGPPVRRPATGADGLARLAAESWLDGCLGEGTAAAHARAEARSANARAVRDAESSIAADEHAHAELAWDILRWTLARGARAPLPDPPGAGRDHIAAEIRREAEARLRAMTIG